MTADPAAVCCEHHNRWCSPFSELCCDACSKAGPADPYDVDDLDANPSGVTDDQAEDLGTFYPDVAAFVAGFLAPTYAHDWEAMDREFKWCSQWWLHVEAVVRLEAMWRAWEALRLDPALGASTWLLHHGDPGMAALTKPHGTFHRCSPEAHRVWEPLPVIPPPPGMFDHIVTA